jgi:hypothetical protein
MATAPPASSPAGLTFPTTGCWRITGAVGDARLEFVVRVRRLSR